MSKRSDIIEKGAELVAALDACGIPTTSYKRGPVADEFFGITLDEKRANLRVWMGQGEVSGLVTDPELKQAVFTIREPARQITRTVQYHLGWAGEGSLDEIGRAKRVFPLSMPGTVTWSLSNSRHYEQPTGSWPTANRRAELTATIAEETIAHFFVGHDENACFISMLPRGARSPKNAHNILRPEGVTKKAVRQGEWFFEPVDDKRNAQLTLSLMTGANATYEGWRHMVELESRSNHVASHMNRRAYAPDAPTFVIGPIFDRDRRHTPLFLDRFHQVFRNTEVIPDGATINSRNWD